MNLSLITQGSTLLYAHYLEPLFTSNERDVDAYLGDLRYTVGGWLQKAFAAAWTLARERLNVSRLHLRIARSGRAAII